MCSFPAICGLFQERCRSLEFGDVKLPQSELLRSWVCDQRATREYALGIRKPAGSGLRYRFWEREYSQRRWPNVEDYDLWLEVMDVLSACERRGDLFTLTPSWCDEARMVVLEHKEADERRTFASCDRILRRDRLLFPTFPWTSFTINYAEPRRWDRSCAYGCMSPSNVFPFLRPLSETLYELIPTLPVELLHLIQDYLRPLHRPSRRRRRRKPLQPYSLTFAHLVTRRRLLQRATARTMYFYSA